MPDVSDLTTRQPGPWTFHVHRFGLKHVIADADGRPIATSVPIGCGPLLAAGPELLATLERVAGLTTPGTAVHEITTAAMEAFREREAIVLADWRPGPIAPPRPRELQIAGVAS